MTRARALRYIVGIDPGVNTGWAAWSIAEQKFANIVTTKMHNVILMLNELHAAGEIDHVVYEDARQRKWINDAGLNASRKRGLAMGAGSVKRDCTILADMLSALCIPHVAIAPQKGMTKWPAEKFERMTGWERRTSDHARDAAMLVFKRKPMNALAEVEG